MLINYLLYNNGIKTNSRIKSFFFLYLQEIYGFVRSNKIGTPLTFWWMLSATLHSRHCPQEMCKHVTVWRSRKSPPILSLNPTLLPRVYCQFYFVCATRVIEYNWFGKNRWIMNWSRAIMRICLYSSTLFIIQRAKSSRKTLLACDNFTFRRDHNLKTVMRLCTYSWATCKKSIILPLWVTAPADVRCRLKGEKKVHWNHNWGEL